MKSRFAFSLAELMVFLVVVSMLLTILFVAWKPQQALSDKNVKYKYAAAYDALNLATFELVAKEDTDPFYNDGDPYKGFKKLCTGLAEYINNEDNINCASPLNNNIAFMHDETFDFKTLTPNFTALNGMKFYISNLIIDDVTPNTDRSYYNEEEPDFTLKFFMVYVDLNGKEFQARPHMIIAPDGKNKNPDVFAFAVLPTGDSIPIGVAEYNIKYLQTRVSYKENYYIYFSPYYSLREAKNRAWNFYHGGRFANIKFKETLSFTYNDYVREILERNATQLYKFDNGAIYPQSFTTGTSSKCLPPSGTALTPFDMCSITVDTPNFGATH